MTWFGVILFGSGTILSIVNLFPNYAYLELTPDGFTVVNLNKKKFIPWEHIEEFVTYKLIMDGYKTVNESIGYTFIPSVAGKSILGRQLGQLVGIDGKLPDNYGKKSADLLRLLNEWKEKHQKETSLAEQVVQSPQANLKTPPPSLFH